MSVSDIVPPPPRVRPHRGRSKEPPRCGVCAKQLRMQDIHGHDYHLGAICRECGPHLVNAITALEIIIMRRG
jgi:hypothetical protein